MRCLLQSSGNIEEISWSPPLPGQPGSSLLTVLYDVEGIGGYITFYSSRLEVLWTRQTEPSHVCWAADRSIVALTYRKLPPGIRGQCKLWWPPDVEECETLTVRQADDANWWLEHKQASVVDWGWSGGSRRHNLAVLANTVAGSSVVRVWLDTKHSTQYVPPEGSVALAWSPRGNQLLVRSNAELLVLSVFSGANLLRYELDKTQPGR